MDLMNILGHGNQTKIIYLENFFIMELGQTVQHLRQTLLEDSALLSLQKSNILKNIKS